MSDKRQPGPPDGGRGRTQVFDSKGMKGSRGGQQGGENGAPDATVGGLPITQSSTGRGRRRGSIDSSDQDRGKDTDDGMGGSESGQSQDQEQLIQKQRARVMQLSSKGDWPALDHALKVLERFVPEGGGSSSFQPLRDVADEVSTRDARREAMAGLGAARAAHVDAS